ncbi:phosphatidate cytidylyltransferase [filamentous cyanobacterium CCP2]|nr:phosphatidate cytidylyltransferase [filamentous cyanobacterium CCP2]
MLRFFDWFLSLPSTGLHILVVAAWLGLVVLLAKGLSRSGSSAEVMRKVVHMGTGNVILLAWWLQMPAWIGIGASVLFSIVTLLSYRFPILPGINSVGRKSLGTFFYAVSIGVLTVAFWQTHPHYAVIGILVMTWGDGLAALVGQRWGQHPYKLWNMQKTWEGSLTMLLVSYAVSSLVLLGVQGNIWQTWLIPIGIAITATALEAFSNLGIDNLTVPIGSAIVAFLLNR